jgi:hypothetical protein
VNNDEWEMIWQDVVMAYFKVLCHHSNGGTEENHEKTQLT